MKSLFQKRKDTIRATIINKLLMTMFSWFPVSGTHPRR